MKQLLILIFTITAFNANAQLIHDQSHTDLSFWKFKVKLEEAILKKDTTLLKSLMADKVLESKDICGNQGCDKSEMIKYYFKNNDNNWNELQQIVRFGFYKNIDDYNEIPILHSKNVFSAPSYLKRIDTEIETVVLGENVNIREKPSLKAKVIRQASYEVFKCDCNITDQTETTYQTVDGIDWLEIKLDNGKVGYIASKFTSSDIYKELTVAKVEGRWKIVSFYSPPGC